MRLLHLVALALVLASSLFAQENTVRGTVNVLHHSRTDSGSADVVVWLTPLESTEPPPPGPVARLEQKNKRFTPHVVAVTLGTEIEFPNKDPFFHNVFSIYEGRPFDLGLYESGTARRVRFTQPGVSYIFCNIHPEMSAAVLVLRTRYFAVSGRDGSFQISRVPSGRYKLEAWYDLASKSEMASLAREVQISPQESVLPPLQVHSSDTPKDHLNKYGEVYLQAKPGKY